MKICLISITALSAVALPFASAQSSAPSAASPLESLVPTAAGTEELVESLAPSPADESLEVDPSCSAHPLCVAEELLDPCCPTDDGVFLSCCDLGDGTPTPPAPSPTEATPPAPTPGAATPEPTPAPVESSPAPSVADEVTDDTAVPTDMPTAGTPPAPDTPAPTTPPAPAIVTLTPKNYSGCIKVNGDGDADDDFRLATCNASDPKQQFKFVGNNIQLAMSDSADPMCLQAGRNGMPEGGKYLRVYECDEGNPLQLFNWVAPDGALALVEYPNIAVVFRGTTANVNSDPIILGDLNESEIVTRKDWTIYN
jgi:hypothetical protein